MTAGDKKYSDWKMQIWLGQQAYERGQFVVAQQKFQKALRDLEALKISDERLAMTLNNLALCLCAQGKHDESDPLYQKALSIDQTSGSSGSLRLAEDLANIATHYRKQGLLAQAEPLYLKALKLFTDEQGDSCLEVAECLNNLAQVYCKQNRYQDAIVLYKKALGIFGVTCGCKSKEYAITSVNLAGAYCSIGRCAEATPLFEEGIRILGYTLDPVHNELLDAMESYVAHLMKVGKSEQAAEIESEIKQLKERRTHR